MSTQPTAQTALFLRSDGSLLLVREAQAVEIRMTADQLLQLGMDALRVAVELDPHCMAGAMAALANTYVLPEAAPCQLN